jgi:methylated-DNA-[protein]-cysteine S-methyltransferase
MTLLHRVVDSPVGPILLSADTTGRLTGLHIGNALETPEPRWDGDDDGGTVDDSRSARQTLDDAVRQLGEYFAGRRTSFDVPLATEGSHFQRQVWAQLRQVPFGTTTSYGQLATALGRPGAARAVGHANARNPIAVIIPCHRVIGSSGLLTGYGGGLAAKRHLLDLEALALPNDQRAEGALRIATALESSSTRRQPSSSVSLTAIAAPHRPTVMPMTATMSKPVMTAALVPSATATVVTTKTNTVKATNPNRNSVVFPRTRVGSASDGLEANGDMVLPSTTSSKV